jgi:SulP family sulfate permease
MAVIGLIDVKEMRHIAKVKKSDLIGLGVAFFATLALGIEIGILVAVVASMLVVFARMSMPHTAVLGHVDGTTSYRNVERFPEAHTIDGVTVVRVDAALSFVNAAPVKKLLIGAAGELDAEPRALVLDASGINDVDATGADMLVEVIADLDDMDVPLHVSGVKGPVRDVLHRAGIWDELGDRVHASTYDAVAAITDDQIGPPVDQRSLGIDEGPIDLSPSDQPDTADRELTSH